MDLKLFYSHITNIKNEAQIPRHKLNKTSLNWRTHPKTPNDYALSFLQYTMQYAK